MFWRKREPERITLSERDRKLLELVSGSIQAHEQGAKLYVKVLKQLESIDKRLAVVEKATIVIPQRQDTLIKLFMDCADKVVALTTKQ